MKFIHIADVHLGMTPDVGFSWSKIRTQEIAESFHRVLELCIEEEIDILLIAGDLFHSPPLMRDLKELDSAFSKLAGTKVVMIAGNHDYMGVQSNYRTYQWKSNVFMFSPGVVERIYFEDLNTEICGFSYEERRQKEPVFNQIFPKKRGFIHILLAHGGEKGYLPIDWKTLKEAGFDYVALGHIHKPEQIDDHIAYCGSLEPLDKNELGRHGFRKGEIELDHKGKIINYESWFLPFSKRQYIPFNIEVKPEMTAYMIEDMVKDRIEQIGNENIYKIMLTGFRDESVLLQEERFRALGNVVDYLDRTVPDYDFEQLYFENKENIIGKFIDTIRKSGQTDEISDKALFYGMEALLKSKNI